ncbi:MAG: hypothetical protein H6704_19510 [Myxococcales bacterium]|nr:hypothetical protein [Myxococcales bacterium]
MDDDGRYRVTRAGREVFAGNQRALVDAARAGRVRDSDLVFDPSTDNWVFARSHPLLGGLTDATPAPAAPRPARPRRERLEASPTPAAEVEARRARRDRAARKRLLVGLAVFVAGIVGVGVWMLYGSGGPGEAMSAYFEEREREQNEPYVPPPGGAEGEQAAVLAEGAPGAPPPPADGAGGRAAPVEVVDPLTFDTAWRSMDSEAIELSDAQRLAYGAQYHDAARRVLEIEEPPPGDARLDQLLAARHRAEFARLNLERVDPKHPDIDRVGSTLGDIETDFQAACRADHGEKFCALKWKWPDWPDAVLGFVAEEKVVVGMTADQVRESWGRPTRLRRTAGGRQFCYGQLCGRSVTIVNDVAVQVDD